MTYMRSKSAAAGILSWYNRTHRDFVMKGAAPPEARAAIEEHYEIAKDRMVRYLMGLSE